METRQRMCSHAPESPVPFMPQMKTLNRDWGQGKRKVCTTGTQDKHASLLTWPCSNSFPDTHVGIQIVNYVTSLEEDRQPLGITLFFPPVFYSTFSRLPVCMSLLFWQQLEKGRQHDESGPLGAENQNARWYRRKGFPGRTITVES